MSNGPLREPPPHSLGPRRGRRDRGGLLGIRFPPRKGPPRGAAPVPIQDGKTIDFSNGSPVLANGAADKAALDAGVRAIDEATRNITIPAQPTPAK